LQKTLKPTTVWREANSSRDNSNITASKAEGRPATTRMPETVETCQQHYLHQQGHQQHNMDANDLGVFTESCQKVIRTLKNS
jgi:hypothetical protein